MRSIMEQEDAYGYACRADWHVPIGDENDPKFGECACGYFMRNDDEPFHL